MTQLNGCERCWPESSEAAWQARRELREHAVWIDESHFNVRALECIHCKHRYLSVFTESVDWVNGDDAQRWLVAPVSAHEYERAKALFAASLEAALSVVPADRRSLCRDFPSDGEARTFWSSGLRVGGHD
ncbi:hypothetical protein QCE63_23365 [Caballeronia sp. LZ065]|nr:hypothetical protein [Caballeronia sp. LZ065]